jgi:hypothetical protein
MAGNQGLGSDNSSSTGSKDVITNKSGGGRLTKEDQRKGGRS